MHFSTRAARTASVCYTWSYRVLGIWFSFTKKVA